MLRFGTNPTPFECTIVALEEESRFYVSAGMANPLDLIADPDQPGVHARFWRGARAGGPYNCSIRTWTMRATF